MEIKHEESKLFPPFGQVPLDCREPDLGFLANPGLLHVPEPRFPLGKPPGLGHSGASWSIHGPAVPAGILTRLSWKISCALSSGWALFWDLLWEFHSSASPHATR